MKYQGDFQEDATVRFMWSTNDGSGAAITRSTDGTIQVYKDGDTTQSTAGITDTEDFDSLTGIHLCEIDTSADAFYAAGSDYTVVLQGATVDSQTVAAVLAEFSIENRVTGAPAGATLAADIATLDGIVDTIKSSTDKITSSNILTIQPLLNNSTLELVKGDSYDNTNGRHIDITNDGSNWPTDLTGWTITFTCTKQAENENSGEATMTATGSVQTATGSSQKIRLEFAATDTDGLALGLYDFDVQASSGAYRATLVSGVVRIRPQQTST